MRPGDRQRHRCPLPPEQRAQQPFVYDPRSGSVIAPWPKRRALPAEDQARLDRVAERIASLDPMLHATVWLWPDDREPVPVENDSPSWLGHWGRDRACYSVGR